jgi:hypothetical protein
MADDRAQFQTEATVCGQESITGHLRSHLAIAQDEVRQDSEHGFARGALDTPDRKTIQPDPNIMRVARQAPSTTAGHLVCELKADGQNEGQHTFDKGLAISKQLNVGRVILKIGRDGPIFAGLAGFVSHGSPLSQMVVAADDPG